MKKEYKLVWDTSNDRLEAKVNKLLAEDWDLRGDIVPVLPAEVPGFLVQAMTRMLNSGQPPEPRNRRKASRNGRKPLPPPTFKGDAPPAGNCPRCGLPRDSDDPICSSCRAKDC